MEPLLPNHFISVAPREIHDLIQRASRVKGCEASMAERIASKITFCEINYGGGIDSWLFLADDDENCLIETFQSVQVLDSLPAKDSLEFSWDPPIPFSFIAQPLNVLQSYGFAWGVDGERSHDHLLSTGNAPIWNLSLKNENSTEANLNNNVCDEARFYQPEQIDRKEPFSEGIQIERHHWEELVNIAANFLLSEEILDNAESPVYE